jgi:hypothetical protein
MSTIKSPACRVTRDPSSIWKLLQMGALVLLTLIWAAGYGFTQETWKPLGGVGATIPSTDWRPMLVITRATRC